MFAHGYATSTAAYGALLDDLAAVGYVVAAPESRVRDERVGAAVVLSGARSDVGAPWFPVGSPALLAVHGDADTVNPFAASQSLYTADRSGSPRYLVRVRGAGHTDAFVSARTRTALVVLIDDFVRASLGIDAAAAARIPTAATVPGVLELVGS